MLCRWCETTATKLQLAEHCWGETQMMSSCPQSCSSLSLERGIQLRGFVFKPFLFLPLENVVLYFPNLNKRQSIYSLGPFFSQIFLEVQSLCLLWVTWHRGLPFTEKNTLHFLEDLLAYEVKTFPGGEENSPILSNASCVSTNSQLQGWFVC